MLATFENSKIGDKIEKDGYQMMIIVKKNPLCKVIGIKKFGDSNDDILVDYLLAKEFDGMKFKKI